MKKKLPEWGATREKEKEPALNKQVSSLINSLINEVIK
jgi:hypothetical protein